MPITANYYVTLRCNQRCEFCNIPHTSNGSACREPTMEQVAQNLRDLRRLGVRILDVTGGEPLLYRHVVEMLALARSLGLITSITTNGMLYARLAEDLVGKVNALLFSLDSADPKAHDRIRGVESFHQTVGAIRLARRLGQVAYVSHVVTNEAMARLDEMVELAGRLDAILYLNPCFSFFDNEGLSPDNARALMKYFGRKNIIVDLAELKLIASGGNDIRNPVCRAVASTIVISPQNELWLPCYHFRQEAIPIEGKLYDLYRHSEAVAAARKMDGRHSFCQGCTIYCYMRSSLGWKYPVAYGRSMAHYVRERARKMIFALPQVS
jgi:MoaA/NifB/PqqE/SkfB family radical SAM enzyme